MKKALLILGIVSFCLAAEKPKVIVLEFDDGTKQAYYPAATQPSDIKLGLSRLGVNLAGPSDSSTARPTIDAWKTSRSYGSPKAPFDKKSPAVDEHGWPLADFGVVIFTEQPTESVKGVYKFSADGTVINISCPSSQAKVANLTNSGGKVTADIEVTGGTQLFLGFTGTNGGLKNCKLLRPGYTSDGNIFTDDFTNHLSSFGRIRFMDFLETNGSTISTWASRASLDDAQWTIKGFPYEACISLANQAHKNILINVPVLADDDHIVQLGKLIKSNLDPKLDCVLEYSNEVWNGQFAQYNQNKQLAINEKSTDKFLTQNNDIYAAWERVAKMDIKINKLTGYKCLLSSQVGFSPPGKLLSVQLGYFDKANIKASDVLVGVASAPYYWLGKTATTQPTLTVDQIINVFSDSTKQSVDNDNVKSFHALAKKYGLKSWAYECGEDIGQSEVALTYKLAAQTDPRMGTLTEGYLNSMFDGGYDEVMYFNSCSLYNKKGVWGLTSDIKNLDTPKMNAAVRVANSHKE